MPLTDSEWGDWDESQWQVPPRPPWILQTKAAKESAASPSSSVLITDPASLSITDPASSSITSRKIPESYQPCLRDFRNWYLWAREKNCHDRYLETIQTLAEQFKLKTPGADLNIDLSNPGITLSEVNLHNMRLDQRNYQEILEQFLRDTKTILDSKGISELCNGERLKQYCSRDQKYLLRYYPASDLTTVYKGENLLVHQQVGNITLGDRSIRREDAELFRRAASRCNDTQNQKN